ncbi:Calreticulin family-domain-containing protein [Chytriomyces cf. hyalinus JEL632]|nr:Calreticulin family-domain-containing protein [Chytriomyces cf. hyalinus JEL632]
MVNFATIASTLLAALPLASATIYFQETFADPTHRHNIENSRTFAGDKLPARWVQSESKDDYGKFKVTAGKFFADSKASRGLQTSQDAKFYAMSAPLDKEFDNKGKDLVLQFTAKFEQNIGEIFIYLSRDASACVGTNCGGGYIKLLPKFEAKTFNGDTPYSIMFGPDICGYDKKIHAIITYKGKNHLIKKTITPGSDQFTHQYTFVLHPDQTYSILLDGETKESGSILESWDLLPPKKIKDPNASKAAEISDPTDKKPANWDDIPATIVDPDAEKPEDWDDEMDGEWEAPKISNPDYKGEWVANKIPNPAYKGAWVHPEIDNPEFKEDTEIYAFKNGHVGFDLWQVKSGTIFDNIIVTDNLDEAKEFAKKTFDDLKDAEKEAKDKLDEKEKKEAEEKEKAEKKDDAKSADAEEVSADEDEHAEL